MSLRSPGNYDAGALSDATGIDCSVLPDMTQQQFRDDCDIQVLAARFGLTGEFPEPKSLAEYGDFSGVSDFHTAMNEVREAEQAFESLPVKLRTRFSNDPVEFWEWLHTSDNIDEAIELGILQPGTVAVGAGGVVSPIPAVPEPVVAVPASGGTSGTP